MNQSGTNSAVVVMDPANRPPGRIAFLFPGQGTLRHAAGAAAHRLLPNFPEYFACIADPVRADHQVELDSVISGEIPDSDWFADTVHQQLGLLALGYALGRQLIEWGIVPSAMVGNSIGEYTAALLAGVWTPAHAAELVFRRARAMSETGAGRGVVVKADAAEVERRLDTCRTSGGAGVSVAVAGPGSVVLSGSPEAIDGLLAGELLHGLETKLLETRRAFHSPAMKPAAQALRSAVASVPCLPPHRRFISGVTGTWIETGQACDADYWARQLCTTIQLDRGVETLLAERCDVVVELGPGASMIGSLRRHRHWRPEWRAVPMIGRVEEDTERNLCSALAVLGMPPGELDIPIDQPIARQERR